MNLLGVDGFTMRYLVNASIDDGCAVCFLPFEMPFHVVVKTNRRPSGS